MVSIYAACRPRERSHVSRKFLMRNHGPAPRFSARVCWKAHRIGTLKYLSILSICEFGETDANPHTVMHYVWDGKLSRRRLQQSGMADRLDPVRAGSL